MTVVRSNFNLNHKLFLAADHTGLLVAFCSACGFHTSFRSRNLLKTCKPVGISSNSHGARAIKAFFGIPSQHPETGLRLSRPYPVALADIQFAESAALFGVIDHDEPAADEPPLEEDLPGPFDDDPAFESSYEDGWLDGFEDFDQPQPSPPSSCVTSGP